MSTDRPTGQDDDWQSDTGSDAGWFFSESSEDDTGLDYRGEASHSAELSGSSAASSAQRPDGASSEPPGSAGSAGLGSAGSGSAGSGSAGSGSAGSAQPTSAADVTSVSGSTDAGQQTAPFTPDWASPTAITTALPAPSTATGGAVPTAAPGTAAGSPGDPPHSPHSPPGGGSSGGSDRTTARAIVLGVMVGIVALFLAWYFLARSPSSEATRATPVVSRATAVRPSPSPTATPTATPTTSSPSPTPTRTTATPTPTPTPTASPTPTPSPTPSPSLNDASNRLGWTYLIDRLGPVTLGLSAEQAVDLGVLREKATSCDAYAPTDLLGATRVYSTGGTVTAIDIRTDAFPSERGVRVGTSLATLKKLYGAQLKSTVMKDGSKSVKQWALTSGDLYLAYVVNDSDVVTRIAIGYQDDGTIRLPPPC